MLYCYLINLPKFDILILYLKLFILTAVQVSVLIKTNVCI